MREHNGFPFNYFRQMLLQLRPLVSGTLPCGRPNVRIEGATRVISAISESSNVQAEFHRTQCSPVCCVAATVYTARVYFPLVPSLCRLHSPCNFPRPLRFRSPRTRAPTSSRVSQTSWLVREALSERMRARERREEEKDERERERER